MNRKPPPKSNNTHELLSNWRQQLITRRHFLILAAGGSVATMFPLMSAVEADIGSDDNSDPWQLIDVVQQHLFPEEDQAPGAHKINALAYLKFIIDDDKTLGADDREFITQGAIWLDGMAQQIYKKSFVHLDEKQRENILQRIAESASGENWISTLLLYITEALLSDPVYGANTNQSGWKWLQHVPGFPRPPADKIFPNLLRKA